MLEFESRATYVGQVERDPQGDLWAVLYFHDEIITRQPVRSLRHGRKCVSDLVLSAADNYPTGPMSVPAPKARLLKVQRLLAAFLPRV